MPRVRKGAARTQAREKLLKAARGYYGTNHLHKYRAKIAVLRAGVYAYRDRRAQARLPGPVDHPHHRRLQDARHALQPLHERLKNAGVVLNRKMLSNIAIQEPAVFDQLVKLAVEHASASKPKAAAKA